MAFPLSEIVLRNIINQGLDSITADLDTWIPEIYAGYRCPLTGPGAEEILTEIRKYFSGEAGDQIEVTSGYPTTLQASNIVYITLNSTQEDTRQGLGDRWESIDMPIAHRVVVPKFDACEYDQVNNILKIKTSFADLSLAYPGYLLRDKKGNLFPLQFPIVTEEHPDFGTVWKIKLDNSQIVNSVQDLEIVSFVDHKIQHRNSIWYWEQLSIVIQAPSYQKAFWLYLAVAYVLQSIKPTLEKGGFEISTFNAKDLGRDPNREPDFVAMRQIDIKWRVQATFISGSSLVPDALNLFIVPGRVNSEEVLTEPTKEEVLLDLKLGLPGQTVVGIKTSTSSFN